MAKKRTLNDIIWPKPGLADRRMWNQNIGVVIMLFNLSTSVEWYEGKEGVDGYVMFPRKYIIDGVLVEFFPHWGFYKVGANNLNIPMSAEDVMTAVSTVKLLDQAICQANSKLKKLGLGKNG